MSFYLNDGDGPRRHRRHRRPTMTTTTTTKRHHRRLPPPPFRCNRHGRTYTPPARNPSWDYSRCRWTTRRLGDQPVILLHLLSSSSTSYSAIVVESPWLARSCHCRGSPHYATMTIYEGDGDAFDSIIGRRELDDAMPIDDSSRRRTTTTTTAS